MTREPKQAERGVLLLALLGLMVVLTMFTGVMLARSRSALFQGAHYRDGVQALQAAKAGASQLLGLLEENPSFESPVEASVGRGSYSVTFDPSQEFYSVNNLTGGEPTTTLNLHGRPVPAQMADLVVTGRSGMAVRRVRVLVQPGFSSARSAAAVGKIRLTGDVRVDGVKSVHSPEGDGEEPEAAPGGLLSKYRSPDPSDPAIGWTQAGGSFELSSLSRLETAPSETGGSSVSTNLQALFPDRIVDAGAADSIPEIDVAGEVASGSGHPLPAGAVPSGGGAVLSELVPIEDSRFVNGNLTVQGDLVFQQGTLYVDGDLHLAGGGLKGVGSVYVSGDVVIEGGNSTIATGQPAGTALLAGGDIEMVGLDAEGYLQQLATTYGLEPQLLTLNGLLGQYSTATDAGGFWNLAVSLSKHAPGQGTTSDPYWVNPLPAPNGSHPHGYASGALPALILGIVENHPGYSTDARAQKVVRALEEMHYHFRHSLHNAPPFRDSSGSELLRRRSNGQLERASTGTLVHPSEFETVSSSGELGWPGATSGFRTHVWDDFVLWPDSVFDPGMSHDRLGWSGNEKTHRSRRDAYLQYQPLDFSWLSTSNLQGLVYARGDIRAQGRFRVVGSVITLGDLVLGDGTELIFNEEYRRLFGLRTPLGILDYEEL